MSGDERRQQLLHVAIRFFSAKGFSGTTTKEIAQAAGVSEATLFKHFANKDELYSAILDYKACARDAEQPFLEVEEKMTARDDFGVFYTMALNVLKHHEQDCHFMRLMLHSALESHNLAKIFVEGFITDIYKFVSGYIEVRQKEGVFRDVNARLVVRAFMGMFIHHSLQNTLWDKEKKVLNVSNEEAAKEFATILLNGIKKQDI